MEAREAGLCKRTSKLTPYMFFDLLLFGGLSDNKSLNQIAIEANSQHGVTISKQALSKRFGAAGVAFVRSLFEKQISKQISSAIAPSFLKDFKQVKIQDSTRFVMPEEYQKSFPGFGGVSSKAGACIQYEFDVKSGKIVEFELCPALQSDTTHAKANADKIGKDDLIIRDLGYFALALIKRILGEKAYFISRLQSKVLVYEQVGEQLERVDFGRLYLEMDKGGVKQKRMDVFIGDVDKVGLTMVVEPMPDAIYQQRIKKVGQYNKRHGNKTSQEYKDRARFNIFITNIEDEKIPPEEIPTLYKIRWQIELVFKTWKSTHRIASIPRMNMERYLCLLYAKLLMVAINWEIINNLNAYQCKSSGKLFSLSKCVKTLIGAPRLLRDLLTVEKVQESLVWIAQRFRENHWLESRKNRVGFNEIFSLYTCEHD